MVNPVIIAGLVAGYTVSAMVTAFLAAEDPDVADVVVGGAADQRLPTRCAGAMRRSRRAAHCLVGRHPAANRMVTTPRR